MVELIICAICAVISAPFVAVWLIEWVRGRRPPRMLSQTLELLSPEWRLVGYQEHNEPMWDATLEARGRRFSIGEGDRGSFEVVEQVAGSTPTFERSIFAAKPSQIAAALNEALTRFDNA